MVSNETFGMCSYCRKRIIWIRTKNGKNMPVDPTLIDYKKPESGKKGKEKIVTSQGEVISADIVDCDKADGIGYISHFATCPKFRR